ncbi:hypothetical protein FRC03_007418 [Tulasnella sp. 419]|nr:hypothetical protein FRC03_007418 [Tulasnella sp. 419]
MTSRSYDSVGSSRRGKERMTDDDVYQYALRVSYLSYLLTPKVSETPSYNSPGDRGSDRDSRDHHSRMSAAISHSIYTIGDVFKDFGRDSQRPLKFPEKLLKVLDDKLRTIALGQDPQFKDQQLVRRSIAAFYNHLAKPDFLRQMEKNRKIEELILTFVTKATDTLKKEPTLQPDGWKMELNAQIALFVRLLRDCLKNVSHVPPELTARMDMYTAKLTDGVEQAKRAQATTVRSPPNASSSNGDSYFPSAGSGTIADMPLVKTTGKLFGKTDNELQHDVNAVKKFCTQKITPSKGRPYRPQNLSEEYRSRLAIPWQS